MSAIRLACRICGNDVISKESWIATLPVRFKAPQEANPDTRLILAAPDLLAALEGLIENAQPDNWDDDCDPDQAEAWRAAFRAVCKAKGLPVPKNMEAAG